MKNNPVQLSVQEKIIRKISDMGVIPIAALAEAELALPLGQALLDGGLPCVELTFRTEAAVDSIYKMSQAYPEILIGAGTVLTVEQAKQAAQAGAKYFLSPGLDIEIVEWCEANNMLLLPGVMTPSDVSLAVKKGLKFLKFFPAVSTGGIPALKSISNPFVGIDFLPTGGINGNNLADFLKLPMVRACGGSWLVAKKLIQDNNFTEITKLTKEAVEIVERVKTE